MLDLILVALSQAAAGPPAEAPAQTPAAQEEQVAPAAPATSENDRNRRRCRIETVTGSRMGRQVCLSRAEEEALSGESRRLLENAMRLWDNQSTTTGGANGP